ncbi:MAG: hypothetical protein AAB550_02680 [Patescibacteria group bacterium]
METVHQKKPDNFYFGSKKLMNKYLAVAKAMGFEDKVIVSPEKPEWSDAKVEINLKSKVRKEFLKKVSELED